MCTLILAWQVFEGVPVVAAANRDEWFDRPSRPPAVHEAERRVVAPTDEEAGGTWIGYNDAGVFVAITNRWTDRSSSGDRSRGLLVKDCLEYTSAETAARHVERALEADRYESFNLVVADADAALLFEWDAALQVRNLGPGVHGVANTGADGAFTIPETRDEQAREQADGVERARTALQPEPGEGADDWLDRAAEVLGEHAFHLCVHGEDYGTRSTSLVTIGQDSAAFYHAEGRPCEEAHELVRGSDVLHDGQI